MKINIIKRTITKVLTLGVALLFVNSFNAKAADTIDTSNTTKTVTLTGYVIDEHCFAKKKADPGKDSKRCFLMNGCIKGGYGIAVPQADGSYQFYYFDGNFFTDTTNLDGTGGQRLAYDIGANTLRTDHLSVTVTGNFTGETKPGVSATDVNYNVLKVNSIKETDTNDIKGYLVDESYFVKNSSNPSSESKQDLLSESAAKSGYGIAVKDNDGSYKFFYLHGNVYTSISAGDATGAQLSAYNLINASNSVSNINVTISGALTGAIKTSTTDGNTYSVVDVYGITENSSVSTTTSTSTPSTSKTDDCTKADSSKTTVTLADTAVSSSVDINSIVSKDQDIKVSDSVNTSLPQDFINSTKLATISSLKIAYNNLSATSDETKLLSKQGYKAISKIYDFNLLATDSDGNQSLITNFDKAISLSVTLTDAELNGVDKNKLKVLYINEKDGNLEVLPTTINGNKITFTTSHFSKYIIGEVQESASTNGVKTVDNNIFAEGFILALATSGFILASIIRAKKIFN